MTGVGSRIAGQGRLLRSLGALVARVDKFGRHRASTGDERRWANVLADALEAAHRRALTPQAGASLTAVEQRVSLTRKAQTDVHATVAERKAL